MFGGDEEFGLELSNGRVVGHKEPARRKFRYRYKLEWNSVFLVRIHNRLGRKIGSSHVALERRHHLTQDFEADEDADEHPVFPVVYE